jgi:hypothetical protein
MDNVQNYDSYINIPGQGQGYITTNRQSVCLGV